MALTTMVAASEYTLMYLAYFALHNRVDEFVVNIAMTGVRVTSVTFVEFFILHNMSANALGYFGRIVGGVAAIHVHNAFMNWKEYRTAATKKITTAAKTTQRARRQTQRRH